MAVVRNSRTSAPPQLPSIDMPKYLSTLAYLKGTGTSTVSNPSWSEQTCSNKAHSVYKRFHLTPPRHLEFSTALAPPSR